MALTFANPWLLLGLLGIPVLYWIAKISTRRKSARVGSLLIWQAVAEESTPQGARRLDRFLVLAMLTLGLLTLASADLQINQGEAKADVAILLDHGIGGALTDLDKDQLSTSGIDESLEGEFAGGRSDIDPAQTLTRVEVMAWLGQQDAAKALLISPMRFDALPPQVEQVSKPVDPEDLAFSKVSVSRFNLFARSTRENASFSVLQDGEVFSRSQADGHDLLLKLPREGSTLTIQRLDDSGEADAPPFVLKRIPAIRIASTRLEAETLAALDAAFDGSIEIVEGDAERDFTLGKHSGPCLIDSNEAEGLLPISGEAASYAYDQRGALPGWLPSAWLTRRPTQGFEADLERDLLSLEAGESDFALIQRLGDAQIQTSLPIFGEFAREEWFPLFIAAAVQETLGRNPLDEARWQLLPPASLKEGTQANWLTPRAETLAEGLSDKAGEFPMRQGAISMGWFFGLLAILALLWLLWVERRSLFGRRETPDSSIPA